MSKSDLQQRLEELPPEQFEQAEAAFRAAKDTRGVPNSAELGAKIAGMTDQEFARFRAERGW